jgi:hypothetical protein
MMRQGESAVSTSDLQPGFTLIHQHSGSCTRKHDARILVYEIARLFKQK